MERKQIKQIKRKPWIDVPLQEELLLQINDIISHLEDQKSQVTLEHVRQTFKDIFHYLPGNFRFLFEQTMKMRQPIVQRRIFIINGGPNNSHIVTESTNEKLGLVLYKHFPQIHVHKVVSNTGEAFPANTLWGDLPPTLYVL